MYAKNVKPELAARVAEEVECFQLPPDWRDGRELVRGFAIDEGRTVKADDALLATAHADGSYTLPVSIADVGSFLSVPCAMRSLARIRGYSWVDKDGAYPLWPNEITLNYFSLTGNAERPGVTMYLPVDADGVSGEPQLARTIVRAQKCRRERFDQAIKADTPENKPFATLYAAAKKLQRYRENHTTSEQRFPADAPPSTLVANEIIYASNRAAARFVLERSIPAIYRLGKEADREMALLGTSADLKDEADAQVRISSPLRRYSDFVSQANIVAYLTGEPFPFNEDAVASIVEQYNARRQKRKIPNAIKAQGIHDGIRAGTAGLSDIMRAFAIPEHVPGSAKIRREAFDYAIVDPQKIRNLLEVLRSSNVVITRARRPDDEVQTSRVLQAKDGTVFPYPPFIPKIKTLKQAAERVHQQRTDAQTLAKIARLPEDIALPWYLSAEEAPEVLIAPQQLRTAASRLGMKLRTSCARTPEGQMTVEVAAVKGNLVHRMEATENTEELARCKAAYQLMQTHQELAYTEQQGLEATEEERQALNALTRLDPKHGHSARHYLLEFLQKHSRENVAGTDYRIEEHTDDSGITSVCTLTFTHQDTPFTITATTGKGSLKKLKDLAAYRGLLAVEAPILNRLRRS